MRSLRLLGKLTYETRRISLPATASVETNKNSFHDDAAMVRKKKLSLTRCRPTNAQSIQLLGFTSSRRP